MSDPIFLPEFATGGNYETEPTPTEKETGWLPGDKPDNGVMNWAHRTTYEALLGLVSLFAAVFLGEWSEPSTSILSGHTVIDVLWIEELGLYVATVDEGVSYGGKVYTSPDGETWTLRALPGSGALNELRLAWSPQLGTLSLVGSFGDVFTSTDATSFTQHSSVAGTQNDVVWTGTMFVSVGTLGRIYTSPDGETWTLQTSGVTQPLYAVAYGNGRLVAVGWLATILYSDDGVTWAPATAAGSFSHSFDSAAYANGEFLLGGYLGEIQSSTDGESWSAVNSGIGVKINAIVWCDTFRTWLFGCDDATIYSSPNGENAVLRFDLGSDPLLAATWSPSQRRAVVVGDGGVIAISKKA